MSQTQVRRRLATVGTGYFSQFHYEAWGRLNVDLVAVCSLNKSEAVAVAATAAYADCAAFDDFETMLDAVKPDLVDIIVPSSYRVELENLVGISTVDIPECWQTSIIIIVDSPERLCGRMGCGDPMAAARALEAYLSK